MSDDSSTQELVQQYNTQSSTNPTVARDNYKGPTPRADSWESQAHHGGPMCYGCCGAKCLVAFIGIVVVLVVCCSYVSQDGQCCSICYWPF